MEPKPMQQQTFKIFADYFQFYLWDEGIGPDAPTEWDDADVQRRIKVAPHVVVICPIRNMTVPVEVQVHDTEPPYDASQWPTSPNALSTYPAASSKSTNALEVPLDVSMFRRALTGCGRSTAHSIHFATTIWMETTII
jgi:hypothetical protein